MRAVRPRPLAGAAGGSEGGARRRWGRHVYLLAMLVPLAAIFSTPLLWMTSTALKSDAQLSDWPPTWIPDPVRWDNFVAAWQAAPFGVYLGNTLTITIAALIGQITTASAVAYGFARIRFPYRDPLFMVLIATMMLPGIVTLIPTYIMYNELGWLDTFLPLVIPSYFGGGAFYIFLLRQFFRSVPMEFSDAAKIDGAGHLRIYLQLILPLSKPALATVAIFSFMGHWNDFVAPLLYLKSQENYTLTLGLRTFMGAYRTQFQYLMAISFLMTLPVIAVFFAAQKYFVQGIVMSGLKG